MGTPAELVGHWVAYSVSKELGVWNQERVYPRLSRTELAVEIW